MGHFEHSDFKCSEQISEHPPKAFFVAGVFDSPLHFPSLRVLYMEAECNLTAIISSLIMKARPKNLEIILRSRVREQLFGQALVREEGGSDHEDSVDHGQRYGIYENDDDDIDYRFM